MESKLEGTWQMIRGELAGEAAPELVTTNTVVTLTAGAYEVLFDGEMADRGTFEIEETSERRTLLLRGIEGHNADRTIPCIFQLNGDRLRVCFGLDGVLPADFTTSLAEPRYLATYRRT